MNGSYIQQKTSELLLFSQKFDSTKFVNIRGGTIQRGNFALDKPGYEENTSSEISGRDQIGISHLA